MMDATLTYSPFPFHIFQIRIFNFYVLITFFIVYYIIYDIFIFFWPFFSVGNQLFILNIAATLGFCQVSILCSIELIDQVSIIDKFQFLILRFIIIIIYFLIINYAGKIYF